MTEEKHESKLRLAVKRAPGGHDMFWEGSSTEEGTLYLVDSATFRALEELPSDIRSLDTLKKNGFAVVATAVE